MKRQTRPFIVEVKQKRGNFRPNRSIWGDLDLAAIAADAAKETNARKPPNLQLIDSDMAPGDAVDGNKPQAEHLMPDPQEAGPEQISTEAPASAETAEVKKRAPRSKAVKAQAARPARRATAKPAMSALESPTTAKLKRQTYSAKERTQKLGQIEKSISRGESIKSATKQVGISEQTYYQWKKAAAAVPESGGLKDLLALEEENARLKKLLAERLRKENAELKRKLGLS